MNEQKERAKSIFGKPWVKILAFVALIGIIVIGIYLYQTRNEISTDAATVEAPEIGLSPTNSGILKQLMVNEGDHVSFNQTVARVGDELIKSNIDGLVVDTNNEIGELFNPGQPVVTVINPLDLRVDANIDENKGLDSIRVGQPVTFTVDAFGSKKFYGTVDSIGSTAIQSQAVFSISDKREVQQFLIKIKFDVSAYPQIKNGMSAKVTIDTK